ncbi:hypothetical protein [Helicobacter pylori]|uniref:hypothetical protein n=1 Tax=Helicobacter pylori TaxID=210 RepID=UPI0039BDE4B0
MKSDPLARDKSWRLIFSRRSRNRKRQSLSWAGSSHQERGVRGILRGLRGVLSQNTPLSP